MCAVALGLGCGGSADEECEGADCPALPDTQCSVAGVSYESGATGIPAGDGCNTCSCQDGQLGCTLMECLPDGPAACNYGNEVVAHAQSRPSPDGCNTCSCNNGQMFCTQRACLATCLSDAACGEGQYCAFPAGNCSSSSSADRLAEPPVEQLLAPRPQGECRSRSEICPDNYAPVCGCDGVTYANACSAESAAVNLAASVACP